MKKLLFLLLLAACSKQDPKQPVTVSVAGLKLILISATPRQFPATLHARYDVLSEGRYQYAYEGDLLPVSITPNDARYKLPIDTAALPQITIAGLEIGFEGEVRGEYLVK